jgi:hypothetical protein
MDVCVLTGLRKPPRLVAISALSHHSGRPHSWCISSPNRQFVNKIRKTTKHSHQAYHQTYHTQYSTHLRDDDDDDNDGDDGKFNDARILAYFSAFFLFLSLIYSYSCTH